MKYLSIIVLITTVGSLASCAGSNDGGSCPETPATIITGLDQSTLLAQSEVFLDTGLVRFDVVVTPQAVQADHFMLAVVANARFETSQLNVPTSLVARIGKFFVRDANALTCIAPEFVSQQPIADITITSDAAVSALYPAGSNLAGVFRVGKQSSSSPEIGMPTGMIVARALEDRETITEYLSVRPVVPLLLAMTLDVENVIASQHVFTITYTIEDSSVYTSQTEAVSITPSITL